MKGVDLKEEDPFDAIVSLSLHEVARQSIRVNYRFLSHYKKSYRSECLLLSFGISFVQVCSCANSDLISDANAKVSTQEDVSATYFLHKKTQETMTHTEGWASSGGVWLSEAVYSYTSQRKEAWAQKGTAFRRTFPVLLKRDKLSKMKLILLLLISCLALHSTKGKSTIKSTLCLFFFLPGLMSQYTLSGQVVEETTSGHVYHPDSLSAFREHPHIESHWESQGPRGFLIDKQKNRNCSTSLVYNSASAYCDYRKSLWLI